MVAQHAKSIHYGAFFMIPADLADDRGWSLGKEEYFLGAFSKGIVPTQAEEPFVIGLAMG